MQVEIFREPASRIYLCLSGKSSPIVFKMLFHFDVRIPGSSGFLLTSCFTRRAERLTATTRRSTYSTTICPLCLYNPFCWLLDFLLNLNLSLSLIFTSSIYHTSAKEVAEAHGAGLHVFIVRRKVSIN